MSNNEELLLKTLTVETLRVYNFMLQHNPAEVTLEQIAKGVSLTKPTVLHHMEKLKLAKLVENTANGYAVKEVVKVAIIRGYTRLLKRLLFSWIPTIFIFFILAVVTLLYINPIHIQIVIVAFCTAGILIAIRQIKKIW